MDSVTAISTLDIVAERVFETAFKWFSRHAEPHWLNASFVEKLKEDCYAAVENEMQEQFQRAFEGGEGSRSASPKDEPPTEDQTSKNQEVKDLGKIDVELSASSAPSESAGHQTSPDSIVTPPASATVSSVGNQGLTTGIQSSLPTQSASTEATNLSASDFLSIQRHIWTSLCHRQDEAALTNVVIMADVRAAVPHKVTMYYERLRLERSARGLGSKGIDGYVGDKLAQFKKLGLLTQDNKFTEQGRARIVELEIEIV